MENRANEISITRIYDAPVQAVWDAWTDPEQVAQWWGPRGFTLTTHGKDLRPGGSWRYTMHGPDGTDYPNRTQYLEVEPCAKLVYDHGANDEQPALFRVTVRFSETDGKTRMEMRMALASPEAAEATRQFIRQAGGDATWDRLAEYLEKARSGKELFVINRSFDTPVATMFQMWTDPRHFSRWLAPTGFAMRFIRADIRPGGSTFYCMGNGEITMYGQAEYLDIVEPGRVVYTQRFCDEHEQIARHPMAPVWPESMLTTVELTEEAPGRTRVTVSWEAYGAVTAEELAVFANARASMTQGWTGSFDKLETYLSELR